MTRIKQRGRYDSLYSVLTTTITSNAIITTKSTKIKLIRRSPYVQYEVRLNILPSPLVYPHFTSSKFTSQSQSQSTSSLPFPNRRSIKHLDLPTSTQRDDKSFQKDQTCEQIILGQDFHHDRFKESYVGSTRSGVVDGSDSICIEKLCGRFFGVATAS